ncbi:hypothetical protein RV06_GL002726 [Enterococcus haemoperoxidus]|nr:hypothetical protein RV06_GL002726 [Enterococcus haemoperoxidus]
MRLYFFTDFDTTTLFSFASSFSFVTYLAVQASSSEKR